VTALFAFCAANPMTIAETLRQATLRLKSEGVPDAQLNAQSLLASALERDRTYLIVNLQRELEERELVLFAEDLERRSAGEPLQYIIGHQEFYGLEFEVNRDVFIPRPETELIVEEVIRLSRNHPKPLAKFLPNLLIVDVGTGSGCLAISLARELTGSFVIANDISRAALAVARRNATRCGVNDRVALFEGDLLAAVAARPVADFVVSNPPYVAEAEVATLQREVREWEPRVALSDSADGLTFYRRLLLEAPLRLKPGGFLICEIGYSQAEHVRELANGDTGWQSIEMLDDLQGIPRTIVLRRR
jgi:release factor glutamine methyltransferase